MQLTHPDKDSCFINAIQSEESTATEFLLESLGLGLSTLVHQGHPDPSADLHLQCQ